MTYPVTTVKKLEPILEKIPYVDSTELRAGEYGNPIILDKLFTLLTLMINSLQQSAAAQAQRLNFLTAWQKAYATKLNTIHVFTANDGDNTLNPDKSPNTQVASGGSYISLPPPTSGSTSDPANVASTARSDLNTLNQQYTTAMNSQNNVVSNDAKALQSAVNQTNDSVQSQSDMATSILQQLQTILTSIYQAAG